MRLVAAVPDYFDLFDHKRQFRYWDVVIDPDHGPMNVDVINSKGMELVRRSDRLPGLFRVYVPNELLHEIHLAEAMPAAAELPNRSVQPGEPCKCCAKSATRVGQLCEPRDSPIADELRQLGKMSYVVEAYCDDCAYAAAGLNNPEYKVDCPNCGCRFGVD